MIMNILLAADGSTFTKKALGFLLANPELLGDDGKLTVLNVQTEMPPHVKGVMTAKDLAKYQQEEADYALKPVIKRLSQTTIKYETDWLVGRTAESIVATAKKRKVHMILMGTHGHNVIERLFLGSVAQRVVTLSDRPVLLVK
jgi:nucleotide-binding universal stress UspA family protein